MNTFLHIIQGLWLDMWQFFQLVPLFQVRLPHSANSLTAERGACRACNYDRRWVSADTPLTSASLWVKVGYPKKIWCPLRPASPVWPPCLIQYVGVCDPFFIWFILLANKKALWICGISPRESAGHLPMASPMRSTPPARTVALSWHLPALPRLHPARRCCEVTRNLLWQVKDNNDFDPSIPPGTIS